MERESLPERTPNENVEAIDEAVDSAVGDDGGDPDADARDEAILAADDTGMLRSERVTVQVEERSGLS